jgi:hypothetical protein
MGLGISVVTGLLAGSYPALYLSSYPARTGAQGPFRAGRSAVITRQALVVLQFAVSIALLIGVILYTGRCSSPKTARWATTRRA